MIKIVGYASTILKYTTISTILTTMYIFIFIWTNLSSEVRYPLSFLPVNDNGVISRGQGATMLQSNVTVEYPDTFINRVTLSLALPETPNNMNVGNVYCEVHHDNEMVSSTLHMEYVHWSYETIRSILGTFVYMVGLRSFNQYFNVRIPSHFKINRDNDLMQVIMHPTSVEIKKAELIYLSTPYGFRWYIYNSPILTYLVYMIFSMLIYVSFDRYDKTKKEEEIKTVRGGECNAEDGE